MGTTCTHRPEGQSIKDFLINELFTSYEQGNPTPSTRLELLDLVVKERVAYGAVKQLQDGSVFGLVVAISYYPSDRHNTCYKEMSEDMGPYESRCPDRILDMLTPTTSEYANAWRARCREYNASQKSKPKLTHGCTVKLAAPVRFTNGSSYDTFLIRKDGRKTMLNAVNEYGPCGYVRLNLKNYDYTVIAA